jgi:Holliday junction resolvasome RuvABC endonuclease subunit
MEPQRLKKIKESLDNMTLEELQSMSDDLTKLISVLVTRQVAIEDVILDRLDAVFSK